jgi:hypothetical protein
MNELSSEARKRAARRQLVGMRKSQRGSVCGVALTDRGGLLGRGRLGVEHRRVDDARAQRVRADAAVLELGRPSPGVRTQRRLGWRRRSSGSPGPCSAWPRPRGMIDPPLPIIGSIFCTRNKGALAFRANYGPLDFARYSAIRKEGTWPEVSWKQRHRRR